MDRKALRQFQIDFYGLANKEHNYRFELDSELLGLFEQDIVKSGKGGCNLRLEKSETMIVLHFDIDATVELVCDVSLRPFDHEIKTIHEIMVKFGDEPTELSDEVIVLQWDTKSINVAEYIYEFLLLGIPMKKVHPELEAERPDLLYVSKGEEEEEQAIDPRWEALKKLKEK